MYCDKCPSRVQCLVEIKNRQLCMALHENLFTLVAEFIRRYNDDLAIVDLQILNYDGPEPSGFVLISKVSMEFLETTTGDWGVEERVAVVTKHQENQEVESKATLW